MSAVPHDNRRVIVMGASAGGVEAFKTIAAMLPPDFPCPILVVLHIGRHESILPRILESAGPLSASHAVHGEPLRPGHFHVAPPDRHLLIEKGRLALSSGPKEHHARPAIDPTMRSAALELGPLAVGVLLTGRNDDGTPGLQAIKACGGSTLVQDPASALHASMPASALRHAAPDLCVPLVEVAPALDKLVRAPPAAAHNEIPARLVHEQALFLAKGDPLEHIASIAKPSPFVCPDCNGGLWEVADTRPLRFRCHTGHGYTLSTLQGAQAEMTDAALWSAFRGLQEEELLLRKMIAAAKAQVPGEDTSRLEAAACQIAEQAKRLRDMIGEGKTTTAPDIGAVG